MKVILLKDIKGVGKKSEIKDVSAGYARNYLIPNKLAEETTEKKIEDLEIKKETKEKEMERIKKELIDIIDKFSETDFHFYPKIGKKQEVFSSVTKDDIQKTLNNKLPQNLHGKLKIKVLLAKPLKTLGIHSVEIDFGFGIKKKINVILNQEVFQ